MLVSLVLLMGVIGLLLFNTSMQQASFATTSLEEQATTLSAREQTLQMELDVLRDPQNVAERAQEMGLVQPCGSATLSLGDGKVLGTPCAPGPGSGLRLQARPPAKPAILNPPVKTIKVPFSSATPDSADTGRASDGNRSSGGRNDSDSNRGAER